MRTLLKIGFCLLVLAAILVGFTVNIMKHNGTAGADAPAVQDVASDARSIGADVTTIVLAGPINLTLRQGAVASMTVRGEQRLLRNVETLQNGDTLNIGLTGMVLHHRQPLEVVLVLPSLATLRISGSGDSEVNGFNGEAVTVLQEGTGSLKFNGRYKQVNATLRGLGDMEMNGGASDQVELAMIGSGDMTVVGSAKEFRVTQTGSGDLDAAHMAAENAVVVLHGSGDAVVQARKSVHITLHGSGDVTVHGNPSERVSEKSGTGDINFR